MIKPIFLTLLLITVSSVAWAEDQYLLSEKTYKALSAAQELMDAEKYQQASDKLNSLMKSTKSGSYERAVVQQTIGFLYTSQEKYGKAAEAFQQALDANALPEKVSQNLRFNLAQLLIAEGQYKRGIAQMEQWLSQQKQVKNQVYVMMASAYYRIENYKKVIEYIHQAIENDKDPKEDWYRLLLSAHMSLKQYKSAITVLETLITSYPYQKVYWDQLASLYLQQNKEMTALAVKTLASRLDLADGKTVLNLSNMYRYLQIPYKAGLLLEKGLADGVIETDFDNLQKLADSWLAAREPDKAVLVLQKMLSKDDSGATHLKLAQTLIGQEKWQQAQSVLSEGVPLLKGDKKGLAHLLLGTTYFHLKQLSQAKTAFTQAMKYDEQSRQAGQWLRHLEDILKENEDESTS